MYIYACAIEMKNLVFNISTYVSQGFQTLIASVVAPIDASCYGDVMTSLVNNLFSTQSPVEGSCHNFNQPGDVE
jgi:hypothetical protein